MSKKDGGGGAGAEARIDMTWEDYISRHLMATGHVTEALIAGRDGVVWAQSQRLQPKPEQLSALLEAMKDGGRSLADDGIRFSGTRYLWLSGEPDVYLSCKRGQVGLYARQTERAVIAAVYQDPITAQQCADCVITLCNYLSLKGF